ncbi:DUF2357 domain-containing protein [Akkermansiaceae bacterium]|nr:DUF2357 domain-containing protein [Akkermansiaceae bacterium]
MSAGGFDILAIPLPDGHGLAGAHLILAASGNEVTLDSDECQAYEEELPAGWRGRKSKKDDKHPPIVLKEHASGLRLRLLETKAYDWALEGKGTAKLQIKSPLQDKHRQRWSIRRQKDSAPSGSFTVINHLGLSALEILSEEGEGLLTVPLEFISSKLDFDTEYRRMTEDIANFCEQLLLSWDAPTSLTFSASHEEEARLILEQFLFLRHFLTDERLGRLLEMIARNPHSQLEQIRTWTPAAMVRSTQHLSDPQGMLRDWQHSGGRPTPGQALEVRKEDKRDTPPNRFLKFALNSFRRICHEVAETGGEHSQTGNEARALLDRLDGILARRFFRNLGPLSRLPLDNQTLQKGEGYREILQAWILTRAAASLNWDGQQDSYEGSSRDVATLYEYWIFLKLHKLLEDFPGMIRKDGSGLPESFIKDADGGIKLNLKSGKHSLSRFILEAGTEGALCIDLHYERTFTSNKQANSGASYSRNFRPDYTLSIYPESFDDEQKALAAGQASHLHFDAKYRAEKLATIFGEDEEDLTSEKTSGKASGNYKRADLLKMHTYNDALRQTIGSYVLYPGDGDKTEMKKFHEIAPGVGAFVMKPGNEECLEALSGFLGDIFTHQRSQFTQFRYLADTNFTTHRNPPQTVEEDQVEYKVARKSARCIIHPMKKKDGDIFKAQGFAYCHAVPKNAGKKLSLDLTIEVGSEFIPCAKGHVGKLMGLGWRAKVTSAKFIAKEKLIEFLKQRKLGEKLSPSSVDHYLFFEFSNQTDFPKLDVTQAHRDNSSDSPWMAASCKWEEIISKQD